MKMKMKRFLVILLSLALVLGLMPGMSMTAYAEDYVAELGETKYSALSEAIDNWTEGKTLTLLADVTMGKISVSQNKTLDLNGHSLTFSGNDSEQRLIQVEANPGVTFNLLDSSGTITNNNATYGANVYIGEGIMTMTGGTINEGFIDKDNRYVTVSFDSNGSTGTMSDQKALTTLTSMRTLPFMQNGKEIGRRH